MFDGMEFRKGKGLFHYAIFIHRTRTSTSLMGEGFLFRESKLDPILFAEAQLLFPRLVTEKAQVRMNTDKRICRSQPILAHWPPSTGRFAEVINLASSEARKSAA